MSQFKTIQQGGQSLFKDRGSRFIGHAVHVKTEDEIKQLINHWKSEHPEACHVCYAFRLGANKNTYRSSDDGEPNNSAGPPILGQIVSFDVTNVLVAVIRYYGGTNLGVGGLINAYRTAAKEALEDSNIVLVEERFIFTFNCGYEVMPEVMKRIKLHKIKLLHQEINLNCSFKVELSTAEKEYFESLSIQLIQL